MKRILILYFMLFSLAKIYGHEKNPNSSIRFIENKNQWNKKVLYKAEIPSGGLFLEKNCITYNLLDLSILKKIHAKKHNVDLLKLKIQGHSIRVHFKNCNNDLLVEGSKEQEDYVNYYLGKDQSKWASNVKIFGEVLYKELYEGIDLRFYSTGKNAKYEYYVLPGADPSNIELTYEGANKIYVSNNQLIVETSVGKIIENQPFAFQIIQGRKVIIPCQFKIKENVVSFQLGKEYNKNYPLTIDPVLIFSTYSGSFIDNFGYTATYDSEGFLYSGSTAFGPGYLTTTGAYQTNFKGGFPGFYLDGTDIAITKYDSTGKKRIYSTYLGGSSDDVPHSLIVDENDNLLIFGTTGSTDFPVSKNAYDTTFAGDSLIALFGIAVIYEQGSDMVISKLSKDGSSLLASTYLGGSGNDGVLSLPYDDYPLASQLRYNYADEVRGEIEIDNNDNVYIASCTKSFDFPVTGNAYQKTYGGGNFEAVVVKLTSDLSTLIWSSYLGGNVDDAAYSIELDSLNNIYIGGGTNSTNFPTTSGALYATAPGGVADGFISCLKQTGDSLLYSTYYGSPSYDQVYFVDLDRFSSVYVFGQTTATGLYYVHNVGTGSVSNGQFVSKLNADLKSLAWSTTFGNSSGLPNISPTAFLVDLCSQIYLSGWGGTPKNDEFLNGMSRSFNMPLVKGPNILNNYYQPTTDGKDFYLYVLSDDGKTPLYGSYYGGPYSDEHVDGGTSRFDRKGKMYQAICAGCGGFTDLPVNPTFPNNSDNCNCGVMKMDFNLPTVVADFDVQPGCAGDTVKFINKSLERSATTFQWIFGDGTSLPPTTKNPTHVYKNGGTYKVTLIAADNATCNLGDTITKSVYISDIANQVFSATTDKDTIYKGTSTYIHAHPNAGYNFTWSPSGSLSSSKDPNPLATPDTTTTYTLTVSDHLNNACKKSTAVKVVVIDLVCDEPYIFVPNAFTPDGDGNNDILYVRSSVIQDLYFTIYDRWGEKVFETRDQNIGWDGTYKGRKLDPAVYDYYLEVTCLNLKKFFKKGNVTLIR